MNNVALITGASSGIGKDLAIEHAKQGGDLVLLARSEQPLNALATQLKNEFGVNVQVIVEDLSVPGAANRVFDKTESLGLEVSVLVNNAGFGGHGLFVSRNLEDDLAMIQVNITALVSLTHLYLPAMIKRGQGRVMMVSSTASFLPGPLQAVYFATKAFVTSFSQAIAEEVREHRITVTALCPGAVKTNFGSVANMQELPMFQQGRSSESVAKFGYNSMIKGKLIAINELKLSILLNWFIPLLPRKIVLKLSRNAMEKK